MRRALVLTTDSSRHWLRASLPPHVLEVQEAPATQRKPRFTLQDVKEFLMAYCACFLAVSLFIA